MSRSDEERVADMVDAAEQIAVVVDRGRTAWDEDRLAQLAVERLLEIVGESALAMSDEGRHRWSDVPWSDIVGLRTVVAHHYHRVDPAQVWTIASVEIPRLASALTDPS